MNIMKNFKDKSLMNTYSQMEKPKKEILKKDLDKEQQDNESLKLY